MRGALLIMALIAMLVVSLLVVRNMTTEVDDGMDKKETIQKTKDTARDVEEKARDLDDRLRDATRGLDRGR